MDYWKECIAEACEDAGVKMTDEQLDTVTSWVEGAHENYGMATGAECIPNPLYAEVESWKKAHKDAEARADAERENFRNNVAKRRNVHPGDVTIHDNGEATYRV